MGQSVRTHVGGWLIAYRRLLAGDERGITGLETAIILIAFIVVASVFAFTVLSAGVFSAEKGKNAVFAGLEGVSSSLKIVGPVVAKDTDNDDSIDEIVFVLATILDSNGINLTVPPNDTTLISLHTASLTTDSLTWTRTAIGKDDGDVTLERSELAELTVDVSGLSPRLGVSDKFTLEVRPKQSASLVIQRTLPSSIDKVNNLD